ncbi:MAG: hypothetical protein ABIO39_08560 [Caulobacteraceae bacterium]
MSAAVNAAPQTVPGVSDLLTDGGDGRITLDPATGRNRYGCAPVPDHRIMAFGSTTVSTISTSGYAAAERLHAHVAAQPSPRLAYAEQMQRIRGDLAGLCGLPATAAGEMVLAASGTDLHLIAADLVRGDDRRPLITVMPDPGETGRGVSAALRSTRFDETCPHGRPGAPGEILSGAMEGRVIAVSLREASGAPRPAAAIDADFEAACLRAVRTGGKVLLTVVDVSKTGLIAPSPALAAQLKARFDDAVEVMVDACQFRLSPASLNAYLAQGFMVAITGSKFVSGPPFSGALLCPARLAWRFRSHTPLPALGDYSARQDWPEDWVARRFLPDVQNFGLMLRWEAALHELRAFRTLPGDQVSAFLAEFSQSLQDMFAANEALQPIDAPALQRGDADDWDAQRTIFTFLPRPAGQRMNAARTLAVFKGLQARQAAIHLGQPVTVGMDEQGPITALRLSASARLVVEALTTPNGRKVVIDRAVNALETVSEAVRPN